MAKRYPRKSRKKEEKKIKASNTGNRKIITNQNTAMSYYSLKPSWSFMRCDFDHSKWGFCQTCESGTHVEEILRKLKDFEGMSWGEIMSIGKGRGEGTKHHFISLEKIIKEAQERANTIVLQSQEVFSLRLEGKIRLWGLIENGVFAIVWYDAKHEICPSRKK